MKSQKRNNEREGFIFNFCFVFFFLPFLFLRQELKTDVDGLAESKYSGGQESDMQMRDSVMIILMFPLNYTQTNLLSAIHFFQVTTAICNIKIT